MTNFLRHSSLTLFRVRLKFAFLSVRYCAW